MVSMVFYFPMNEVVKLPDCQMKTWHETKSKVEFLDFLRNQSKAGLKLSRLKLFHGDLIMGMDSILLMGHLVERIIMSPPSVTNNTEKIWRKKCLSLYLKMPSFKIWFSRTRNFWIRISFVHSVNRFCNSIPAMLTSQLALREVNTNEVTRNSIEQEKWSIFGNVEKFLSSGNWAKSFWMVFYLSKICPPSIIALIKFRRISPKNIFEDTKI